jgi:hypothetical protein
MSIRATLLRFCELSWQARTELKAWLQKDADKECFSNPTTLRVASAQNAGGQAVSYCLVEQAFVVSGFAVNQNATPDEAQLAGDSITMKLEDEATRAGASKLLLVVPRGCPAPGGEWKELKVYERRIAQAVALGGVACATSSQATRYLN